MDPPQTAPNFTLTDQEGQLYTLADQRGKAVLLFFGYTHCPDVCPQTLVDFRRIKSALGPLADRVQFVFVTLDPERDTPEKLKEYLEIFDPSFVGLSGQPQELEPVWQAYGAFAQKTEPDENGHYWVIHSSYTYMIDPDGDLRVVYSFDTPPDDIVADLLHLIS